MKKQRLKSKEEKIRRLEDWKIRRLDGEKIGWLDD